MAIGKLVNTGDHMHHK